MLHRLLNHVDDHPLRIITASTTFLAILDTARRFDWDMLIKLVTFAGVLITTLIGATTLYRKWFGVKKLKRPMSHVLIIDDSDHDLQLYSEGFSKANCKVITRSRFDGAVETLEDDKQRIDLVLLDARMPGQDVTCMYQRILTIRPGTPIVIYSGVDLRNDIIRELVRISPPTFAIKDNSIDLFVERLVKMFRLGKIV
jgi:CheY-like chemotaxis protein